MDLVERARSGEDSKLQFANVRLNKQTRRKIFIQSKFIRYKQDGISVSIIMQRELNQQQQATTMRTQKRICL